MNTPIRILFVYLFAFPISLVFAESSSEFLVFKQVAGVVKVDYAKPFLWVVVEDGADLKATEARLRELADQDADPDEAAIKGRYNLHVRENRLYREEKRMFNAIARADTAKGMRELYRLSFRAAIYDLDWEGEKVKYSRSAYTSKPYMKQEGLSSEFTNWDKELIRIDQLIGVYSEKEIRPDKVICFVTFEFGELVYPVFGDEIKVGQEYVSYERFAKVLGENPKPIMAGSKSGLSEL